MRLMLVLVKQNATRVKASCFSRLTLQNAEAVEPLQDWIGELDVLCQGKRGVVPPSDGVGRRNDRAPAIATGAKK